MPLPTPPPPPPIDPLKFSTAPNPMADFEAFKAAGDASVKSAQWAAAGLYIWYTTSFISMQKMKNNYLGEVKKAAKRRSERLGKVNKELSDLEKPIRLSLTTIHDGMMGLSDPGLPITISYPGSIMNEPRTVENPTELQSYDYAQRVSDWAQKVLPPEKFDPETPKTISSVELKLMNASYGLTKIKALDDELAEEQNIERSNPFRDLPKEQLKETAKEMFKKIVMHQNIDDLFTLAEQAKMLEGNIISAALKPTVTSEVLKISTERLQKKIQQQLDAYAARRLEKFPQQAPPRLIDSIVPPQQPLGPVLRSN
jgi:hypothetical protein